MVDDDSDPHPLRGLRFPLHPVQRLELAKHLVDALLFREGFRTAEKIEQNMTDAAQALHKRVRRVQNAVISVGIGVASMSAVLIVSVPSLPWWSYGVILGLAPVSAARTVERWLLRRDLREVATKIAKEDEAAAKPEPEPEPTATQTGN